MLCVRKSDHCARDCKDKGKERRNVLSRLSDKESLKKEDKLNLNLACKSKKEKVQVQKALKKIRKDDSDEILIEVEFDVAII